MRDHRLWWRGGGQSVAAPVAVDGGRRFEVGLREREVPSRPLLVRLHVNGETRGYVGIGKDNILTAVVKSIPGYFS